MTPEERAQHEARILAAEAEIATLEVELAAIRAREAQLTAMTGRLSEEIATIRNLLADPLSVGKFVKSMEFTTHFRAGEAAITAVMDRIKSSGSARVVDVARLGPSGAGAISIVEDGRSTKFVPAAGFLAPAGYDYTVALDEDQAVRDTGRVHLRVRATTLSDLDLDQDLDSGIPRALREVKISSGRELQDALDSDLQPGTHLTLEPGGDYSGSYSLRRPGIREAPIFVRGARGSPVRFAGTLDMTAPWVGVGWLQFGGGGEGRKVEIAAPGGRVTRCLFDRVEYDGMIYLTGNNHPEIRVDHNEFRNISGSAVRSELKSAADHKHMWIDNNYFNGHSPRGGNEAVLQILTDAFNDGFLHYHRNLFRGCLTNNSTGQGEIISVKTGAARLTENTVVETTGYFSLRETNRCLVFGNWMESGSYIKVFGDDHVIRNNHGKLEINGGNCLATDPCPDTCRGYMKAGRTTVILKGDCRPGHTGVRKALIENHEGPIEIVEKSGSSGLTDIVLRNNSQAISGARTRGGMEETGVGEHQNTARRLTPADVGVDSD